MNDDPNSARLAPLVGAGSALGLVDALKSVTETRPAKPETVGTQPGPRWTSRHKPSGKPPEHRLFDQIWVSPALEDNVKTQRSTGERNTAATGPTTTPHGSR